MNRIPRALIVPGIALLLTGLAALAPLVFRRMDAFRVRRIEVSGAQFLSPEAALAITGITDSSSVFDDFDAWTARLRAQRMIADARVMRKLPGTLRIDLIEAEPVALIRTTELRAVDAIGRLLPFRPAGKALDVPLLTDRVRIRDDSTADVSAQSLIAAYLQVRAYDAELADAVSEIAAAAGGGVRLVLRRPHDAELLLPVPPHERTLREVLMAMDHLRSERIETSSTSSLDRLARIEARYPDELFVMLRPARSE